MRHSESLKPFSAAESEEEKEKEEEREEKERGAKGKEGIRVGESRVREICIIW